MANVFGILTAIVLAIAAFVAVKNKNAYESEISNRKEAQTKLAASQDRLQTAEDNLAATNEELSKTQDQVAAYTTEEANQKTSNENLSAAIEAKKPEIASNKEKLDAVQEQVDRLGPIKGLAAKMRGILAEQEDLKESVDQSTAKLNNLIAESKAADAVVAGQKAENEYISKGESFPDMKTTIRSIYPNWGFVTLGAGNNSGVVTNSVLNVVRNGEVIAKLLVTAVESNSASASIVPDSLAEGTVLSTGDVVVPGAKDLTSASN
ncbi:hypothetical protein JIN85_12070 [Luteolibacter pohnpeiensis]|uniref:Uncharacterized protein n=1 Tax=Luteolibacter pohnpeiensis TaxID=454153 RepID=A0A934SDC1_9BACT|nr:hypothetical protein [Luteolibacter pohnpeiensis]MBK1883158.1 hypothetical protein [Luteolibacter pohnpeiensis]